MRPHAFRPEGQARGVDDPGAATVLRIGCSVQPHILVVERRVVDADFGRGDPLGDAAR